MSRSACLDEAREAFGRLTELRVVHDWRPAVRMAPYTPQTEGHMIVIEPNGDAQGVAGCRCGRARVHIRR